MKPLRLEVKGFTAFREPAVVELAGRQLFVITGPTGAGKSSLLDAITWALYGQVPRVGTATRQLITHGEKSMAVRFDFTARGETYRVSRHAPTSVGTRLERLTEAGEWQPLADRAREVTAQVTQILGLDYQTFTKTIVLPQGSFDAFLRGDEKDRRAILTRLLGLDTYENVGRMARARARGATDLADQLRQQIERLTLAAPGALSALEKECKQLERRMAGVDRRREQLSELRALARVAEEAARALAAAREEATAAAAALCAADEGVGEAERALAEATERSAKLAAEREDLSYDAEDHQRLRDLATLVEQRAEASRSADAASCGLAAAEAAVQRAASEAATKRGEAAEASETLEAAAAVLAAVSAQAQGLSRSLGTEATAADEARAQAERDAVEHERRVQSLDALARQVEALAAQHSAAERTARESLVMQSRADSAHADAAAALDAAGSVATERRADLEAARVQDAAAALREGLSPGDPCPVCGEPIAQMQLHVATDLREAQLALDEAERALDEARTRHEQRSSAAARASASGEHAEEALAGVLDRLEALDAEIAGAGIDRGEVPTSVEAAREGAATARAHAAELAQRAERARAAERELSLLLARVPAGIASEASEAATDSGEAVLGWLEATLADHERAMPAARAAAAGARDADAALGAATTVAEQARVEHARATKALKAASGRLASATDGACAPEHAGEALAEMDRKAERARVLDAAERESGAAQAAAVARSEERCRDRTRAAELAESRSSALAAVEECERAESAAFTSRWEELAADADGKRTRQAVAIMLGNVEREAQEVAQSRGAVRERVERARSEVEEAAHARERADELALSAAVSRSLELELHGDRFIAYVQREALQVLAADASLRLRQLTSGRYRLIIEGDDFAVVDGFNGDERRSVKTLSGGETFLASLALSLALSERLPELAGTGGAVSLESLFLDEGFGSLDAEALDVAIEGLEALSGGQRMVGVISHVPQLAERLQDSIEIVKESHTSLVRT